MPRGACFAALLVAGSAASTGACSRTPAPCSAAAACGRDEICSAGRCVAASVEPSSVAGVRHRASSRQIYQISERYPDPIDTTSITLGSRGTGDTAVYLRFDPVWSALHRIDAAFVVLDPLPGTQSGTDAVDVDAWRVLEDYDRHGLSWTHKPDVGRPHASAIARTSPPSVLYIDVSEWVRYVKVHPNTDYGLALQAAAGEGLGSSYSTGLGGGAPPALDVYGD